MPLHSVSKQDSLEDYISAYIDLKQQAEDNKFLRGQLLNDMLNMGVKAKWISSQTGDSPAQIRELVKTYRAFPDESMRVPELSWYHHRLAANTNDPAEWIKRAADNQWSTREMREQILIAQGRKEEVAEGKEKLLIKAEKHIAALKEIMAKDSEVQTQIISMLREIISECETKSATPRLKAGACGGDTVGPCI